MKTLRLTLKPQGAFASALQGDTFFGQLCWVVLRLYGEEKLNALLASYQVQPFAVISDAFPTGFLPKPSLPLAKFNQEGLALEDRKLIKKRNWVAVANATQPVAQWLQLARTDADVLAGFNSKQTQLQQWQKHMHNNINRMTGTTGEGFAPYAVDELWYANSVVWDVYALVDEQQFSISEFEQAVRTLGELGYGKDANIGAGRFSVESITECALPHNNNANAYLTLANSAPQGLALHEQQCFYQPFTRYGRHGDWAVLVNPFKAPILLAKTGAVLTPIEFSGEQFMGQGLGGKGEISNTIAQTVHQGYAPVLHIHLATKD